MKNKILKWKNRIGEIDSRRKYYAIYTCGFLTACLGVYIWFLCGRKTFIWRADGWNEYYKALVYYAQYLRSIIRGIVRERELIIPNWDFSLGEGSDVLQTLQCFGIGDPIVALSVFVPADYLYIFYDVSTLLRLYLAGIVFSALCFQLGNKNRYAVLAGTMAYVFSAWAVYNSSVHPYFITPMICFPLLILGIEKIIQKESPLLFSIAVFLSAVCNFYFFYILVFLTVLYVFVRLLYLYKKEIKKAFSILMRIGWSALLGAGLSAVILAPMCYIFLDNDRVGSVNNFQHLFYPLAYYSRIFGMFLSNEAAYGLHMGFSVPILLAVCRLFIKKKEKRFLKVLFVINIVFIMIPAFGQVFNGFSYMSNRWCFAFTLLCAYILTVMWQPLMEVSLREGKLLFLCVTVYAALCMLLENSRTVVTFTAIVLCYIFLFVISAETVQQEKSVGNRRNAVAFCILFISIFMTGFWQNSSAAGAADNASEGVEAGEAAYQVLKMNEASAIQDYAELTGNNEFYRYSGRGLTRNAGQLAGVSATQYYYSFSNPYLTEYRNELELLETGQSFSYEGYDDRPFLMSLASVMYYAAPFQNNYKLPYGLQHIWTTNVRDSLVEEAVSLLKAELGTDELSERQEQEITGSQSAWWSIYENEYFLPIAYTYDSYIPESIWKTLSAVQKQETMLQTVHLNETPSLVREGGPELTCRNVPYEITCDNSEISMQGNTFIVTAAGASATLSVEGLPDCETYFSIKGLEYEGVPMYELYFGDETVDPYNIYNWTNWKLLSHEKKKAIKREKLFWTEPEGTYLFLSASTGGYSNMSYKTPDFSWYSDRHNFTADLFYSEEAVTSIKITFEKSGIYRFDEIEITCQPMEQYAKRIEDLKQFSMRGGIVDTDRVSGTIRVDSPKILCFSIPYSDGWKAYIDGNEVPIYHANVAYMAVEIDEGEHEYVLEYETPLLKTGCYISLISLIIFAAVSLKRIFFCMGRCKA